MGILSKGIGFIREIIYANNFGLSREFDLYLASVAFPIVINTAMIYLCQNYFIPVYHKIKRESEERSNDFFNYNFWWFIFGGLLLAFLLYVFSDRVLDFYLSSLSDENRYLGIQIFSIFLLTIPINAGMSVITAYLQAEFNFVYPVFAQVILNIIVIILLIFFTNILHIFVLPVAFVTAYYSFLKSKKHIEIYS